MFHEHLDRKANIISMASAADAAEQGAAAQITEGLNDFIFGRRCVHSYIRLHEGRRLYVILSAVGNPNDRYPIFHRISWESDLEGNIICLDDPTRSENIGLAPTFYFGDRENDLRLQILRIVRLLQEARNIRAEDVCFLSSSNGGFAAISLAHLLPGSLCLALCPQVDVEAYFGRKTVFFETLGIRNPSEYVGRLTDYGILDDTESRYIIYSNIGCEADRQQIDLLCGKAGFRYGPGLNRISDNILLIIADIDSLDPHLAQPESRFCRFLSENFDRLKEPYAGDVIDAYLYEMGRKFAAEKENALYRKYSFLGLSGVASAGRQADLFLNPSGIMSFRIGDCMRDEVDLSFRIRDYARYFSLDKVGSFCRERSLKFDHDDGCLNIRHARKMRYEELHAFHRDFSRCFDSELRLIREDLEKKGPAAQAAEAAGQVRPSCPAASAPVHPEQGNPAGGVGAHAADGASAAARHGGPPVSVIIPVWNAERHLEQCLDSVVGQTLRRIEIILVDDGSTDGSAAILRRYADADPRIILAESARRGAANARNAGLRLARGEYLCFLDSDDFFAPVMLERAYAKASEGDADIVFWLYEEFDSDTGGFSFPMGNGSQLPGDSNFAGKNLRLHHTTPAPWNKLFRREMVLAEGIGFQDLPSCNDLFFSYAAELAAKRMYFVDEVLTFYRRGHDCISKHRHAQADSVFRAAERVMGLVGNDAGLRDRVYGSLIYNIGYEYGFLPDDVSRAAFLEQAEGFLPHEFMAELMYGLYAAAPSDALCARLCHEAGMCPRERLGVTCAWSAAPATDRLARRIADELASRCAGMDAPEAAAEVRGRLVSLRDAYLSAYVDEGPVNALAAGILGGLWSLKGGHAARRAVHDLLCVEGEFPASAVESLRNAPGMEGVIRQLDSVVPAFAF
ncbi:MAG: glycosyltransferase, partial [Mailhella sp.]|nr:glycosyltransferase [Mailhella sp.]